MKLVSHPLAEFWECYELLPPEIQEQADKQYALFSTNPRHPSLHFKAVGRLWSVRISRDYRAVARREGNDLYWLWIGRHDVYDRILKG